MRLYSFKLLLVIICTFILSSFTLFGDIAVKNVATNYKSKNKESYQCGKTVSYKFEQNKIQKKSITMQFTMN